MNGAALIARLAAAERLAILGILPLDPEDGLEPDLRSLVLLGPAGAGFWPHLTASREWADGGPDPVDRWSERVISAMAGAADGQAVFPFAGPPHRPFYRWALRSGQAFASPVTLLVHARAGLMVSYRGAIALRAALPAPPPGANPCETCPDKPCLAACPPAALDGRGYDVPACHAFLDTPAGSDCLSRGCAVRRACPLSRAYGRLEAQSAYHMRLFHP